MKIEKIGVIGAGTMGNGIAQAFAVAGFPVVLQDLSDKALERARITMEGSLARHVKKALCQQKRPLRRWGGSPSRPRLTLWRTAIW